MKITTWTLGFFFVYVSLNAIEPGVYELSDDPSVFKPLTDRITGATLDYISNDNTRYALALGSDLPFSRDRFNLVAGDKTLYFTTGGSLVGGKYWAHTLSNEPEAAKEIIRLYHPAVRKRHHPGHRILVNYLPAEKEFEVGKPVMVSLRITNVGASDFVFEQGSKQRGSRDNQFAFSAQEIFGKMLPDIGDPRHMGGLCGSVTIKPGESHDIPVDLAKWFNFKKGLSYDMRGAYSMDLLDPPGKDGWNFVAWQDYACAEFRIQMKD